MEYYSAIKKNEIMKMESENRILSKVTQGQKAKEKNLKMYVLS